MAREEMPLFFKAMPLFGDGIRSAVTFVDGGCERRHGRRGGGGRLDVRERVGGAMN